MCVCVFLNYSSALAVLTELHGVMVSREWIISRPLACRAIELSFLVTIVTPFAFQNFGSRETCHAVNGNVDWKFGVVFIWTKKIGN